MSLPFIGGLLFAALGAQDVQAATARVVEPASAQAPSTQPLASGPLPPATATSNSTAPEPAAALSANWAQPVVPSDTVIRRAVRETIIDDREQEEAAAKAAAKAAAIPERYSASSNPDVKLDKYQRFEKGFIEAKVPGCLQKDGLKRQPTFIFMGLLALPFIPIAALRGKCN